MRKNIYKTVAENDLAYLESVLQTGNEFYNQLAVQCKEVTEKFLKGYLTEAFFEEGLLDALRKIDMVKIACKLNEISPKLKLDINALSYLNTFDSRLRYPGDDFYTVSKADFDKCLSIMYDTVNKLRT